MRDCPFPRGTSGCRPTKLKILAATQKEIDKVETGFQKGVITDGERYSKIVDLWTHAREKVGDDLMDVLRQDFREDDSYVNPIYCMVQSGARGSIDQIRQLGGMRGLMAKPSGKIIETPIKANFREGLKVLEYFSSTHGARKGLADTALKDRRRRLPDPQADRRGPERGDHDRGLRHAQRRHQEHRVQGREGRPQPGAGDPRPRGPGDDHRRHQRRGGRA